MDLDDLIAEVEGDEPLDRLSSAMGVKADLDELGDALIGHFVDEARRAGSSWSEIGTAMGVTKQAAQQRHTSERPGRGRGRFGRFTPRARNAVREAGDAAHELRHVAIGTEHLLLGLLAVSQGIAARSLTDMGVTRDAVLAKIQRGEGTRRRGHLPFSPLAKQAMEATPQIAMTMAHNYIGTEHLLLALFRVRDGLAATLLSELGITEDRVRNDIVQRISRIAS
jgi:hypothetical protein